MRDIMKVECFLHRRRKPHNNYQETRKQDIYKNASNKVPRMGFKWEKKSGEKRHWRRLNLEEYIEEGLIPNSETGRSS